MSCVGQSGKKSAWWGTIATISSSFTFASLIEVSFLELHEARRVSVRLESMVRGATLLAGITKKLCDLLAKCIIASGSPSPSSRMMATLTQHSIPA